MTLEELSYSTFYEMENYSQLLIDLVEEVEDLVSFNSDLAFFGAKKYDIQNILEIIDKTRTADIEALKSLIKILDDELAK